MTNIRATLGWTGRYHEINREERNLAALLYHALLLPGNLERFLVRARCPFAVRDEDVALYFEYAMLRDLWFSEVRGNEDAARAVLRENLPAYSALGCDRLSVHELNQFFGARSKKNTIQMPGRWSVRRFLENIEDDALFLEVCRFKWCFNAKPDLVLQLGPDEVVCIEAKFESPQGWYPSHAAEKREFTRRGLPRVSQTALQRYLFEELLGMKAHFLFLLAEGATATSDSHGRLTWREAFADLDLASLPPFARAWIARL